MLKLYFSNTSSIISTVLILVFTVVFSLVFSRRNTINHWGLPVLFAFIIGLVMSIMSGMRDKISTPQAIIPNNTWAMTLLCILGGLAFAAGIIMIIVRKQNFWQAGFYSLSAIIIVKTIITELYRIAK